MVIRLRKIKRAWREKRIAYKKGTNSHLSDGDLFEKKLNVQGVTKDFWFIVSSTK